MNINRLNPELEQLRNSVPQPPNVDEILHNLVQKTEKIHAAFLFCGVGEKLLQKLSLCLCATKHSLHYSGWKELGFNLGLDPLLQQSLEHCNINDQDPVFNMLFAYIQKSDATISKIYKALLDIKRPDIIFQTQSLVEDFYQKINDNFEIIGEKSLLKPLEIPRPPHILKNLDDCKIDDTINKINRQKINEISCQSTPVAPNNRKTTKKYDKVVMLTYNSANWKIARNIAEEFRKLKRELKIGIIMLDEHADKVNADPETFISNCFAQADYVLPIMTTDYLDVICSRNPIGSGIGNVDGAYMKYVYTLMTYDFMQNGCRNYKIRCVIPDEEFDEVQKHSIGRNPEFRVWVKLSEIHNLINRIC